MWRELQTGAAADIEDADTLVGAHDLCRRGTVERRAICGELGVPQVGDVVEEVGQALDIVADAAGIPGDPPRLPQALEFRIERSLVVFQRHTFSVAAPVGAAVTDRVGRTRPANRAGRARPRLTRPLAR